MVGKCSWQRGVGAQCDGGERRHSDFEALDRCESRCFARHGKTSSSRVWARQTSCLDEPDVARLTSWCGVQGVRSRRALIGKSSRSFRKDSVPPGATRATRPHRCLITVSPEGPSQRGDGEPDRQRLLRFLLVYCVRAPPASVTGAAAAAAAAAAAVTVVRS